MRIDRHPSGQGLARNKVRADNGQSNTANDHFVCTRDRPTIDEWICVALISGYLRLFSSPILQIYGF